MAELWRVVESVEEGWKTVQDGFASYEEARDWKNGRCTIGNELYGRSESIFLEAYNTEAVEIRYGIFGTGRVIRAADGSITLPVLVQGSGLFAGAPPEEMRIVEILPPDITEEEIDAILEEENKKRDLPLCVRRAKIQIL